MLQLSRTGWTERAMIDNSDVVLTCLEKKFGNNSKVKTCLFQQDTIPVHCFEIQFDFGTALIILTPTVIEVSSTHFTAFLSLLMFVELTTGIQLQPV